MYPLNRRHKTELGRSSSWFSLDNRPKFSNNPIKINPSPLLPPADQPASTSSGRFIGTHCPSGHLPPYDDDLSFESSIYTKVFGLECRCGLCQYVMQNANGKRPSRHCGQVARSPFLSSCPTSMPCSPSFPHNYRALSALLPYLSRPSATYPSYRTGACREKCLRWPMGLRQSLLGRRSSQCSLVESVYTDISSLRSCLGLSADSDPRSQLSTFFPELPSMFLVTATLDIILAYMPNLYLQTTFALADYFVD